MNKKAILTTIKGAALGLGVLCCITLTSCGSRSEEALKNEQAYRQLGINKLKAGEYEEAVTAFQKALDQSVAVIEDLELDICYYKALAQYKSGDIKGAIKTYDALTDYDKKSPDAFYLRGCLYLKENEAKKAQADFKQAIENDDGNGTLYNGIAENLLGAGLKDEADQILKQAMEVKGSGPEGDREKGYTYYLLGEYDSAKANLEKAVKEEDSQAVLYLAKVYEAEGDTDQAQKMYETFSEKNPDDTETLNSLGWMKMGQGDFEQALKLFQTALAVEGASNEQELRKNEILALEQSGDFAGAKEKMGDYVKDYPKDEEALREYEFLKTR